MRQRWPAGARFHFLLPLLATLALVVGWRLLLGLERTAWSDSDDYVWRVFVARGLRVPLFVLVGALVGAEQLLRRAAQDGRWRLDVRRIICALPAWYLASLPILNIYGPVQQLHSRFINRVLLRLEPVDSVAAVIFGYLLITSLRRDGAGKGAAEQG